MHRAQPTYRVVRQKFGKEMWYGEYCSQDGTGCSKKIARVNTAWATHPASWGGIAVSESMKVFMHDVRFPFWTQYSLHAAMRALRSSANLRALSSSLVVSK